MEKIEELIKRYPAMAQCASDIYDAYEILRTTFVNNGKVLVCGNGGSASDADHIVGELMKGFNKQRPVSVLDVDFSNRLQGAMPAINLCAQTALITAIANDIGADLIFAQQVFGYGNAGDTLIAISTSGNSDNVVKAVQVAKEIGMNVIALTGSKPSVLSGLADTTIKVPATDVYKIQELHLPLYHALCAELEDCFFVD